MQTRNLGNSRLDVSAIGLGCVGMSFGYGTGAKALDCPHPRHDESASTDRK